MLGNKYWKSLYKRTMTLAYSKAFSEIENGIRGCDEMVLDCGAYHGNYFYRFEKNTGLTRDK